MNKITFMDLSRQCSILKSDIFEALSEVYDDSAFISGKYVDQFEKEFASYIGVKHCVGVSNGTDALFLACKALDIGPNDEVIVPSNTFIATAWAPFHCGANVVFADSDLDSWLIDVEKIESLITNKTKAIIVVHLYGLCVNMSSIKSICEKYNIKLIEDCAQAHGAKWNGRKVGTFGDVSCFSFYPGKNLGAFGDAGAVLTNDDYLNKKIRAMKDHGSFEKYKHTMDGYNMRMDGFQAAVLSVKLKYLDKWIKRRQVIANEYYCRIRNNKIKMQALNEQVFAVYHLFVVLVDDRDSFLKYMENNNILCGIHYPIPCHLQPIFSNTSDNSKLVNAEYISNHCVSLPIYPELMDSEVDYVISTVNNY